MAEIRWPRCHCRPTLCGCRWELHKEYLTSKAWTQGRDTWTVRERAGWYEIRELPDIPHQVYQTNSVEIRHGLTFRMGMSITVRVWYASGEAVFVDWFRTVSTQPIVEAVVAVLETLLRLLDSSESNDTFSINGVDLARDFGIGRSFNQRKWIAGQMSSDIGNAKRRTNRAEI
jgi:hypothetical protein